MVQGFPAGSGGGFEWAATSIQNLGGGAAIPALPAQEATGLIGFRVSEVFLCDAGGGDREGPFCLGSMVFKYRAAAGGWQDFLNLRYGQKPRATCVILWYAGGYIFNRQGEDDD